MASRTRDDPCGSDHSPVFRFALGPSRQGGSGGCSTRKTPQATLDEATTPRRQCQGQQLGRRRPSRAHTLGNDAAATVPSSGKRARPEDGQRSLWPTPYGGTASTRWTTRTCPPPASTPATYSWTLPDPTPAASARSGAALSTTTHRQPPPPPACTSRTASQCGDAPRRPHSRDAPACVVWTSRPARAAPPPPHPRARPPVAATAAAAGRRRRGVRVAAAAERGGGGRPAAATTARAARRASGGCGGGTRARGRR